MSEMDLEDEDLTQAIRLLDIFGIGPLMIYAGMKSEDLPRWVRASLVLFGGTTIAYNGVNYLNVSERQKERIALEELAAIDALESGED
jgi:hypothetical protein